MNPPNPTNEIDYSVLETPITPQMRRQFLGKRYYQMWFWITLASLVIVGVTFLLIIMIIIDPVGNLGAFLGLIFPGLMIYATVAIVKSYGRDEMRLIAFMQANHLQPIDSTYAYTKEGLILSGKVISGNYHNGVIFPGLDVSVGNFIGTSRMNDSDDNNSSAWLIARVQLDHHLPNLFIHGKRNAILGMSLAQYFPKRQEQSFEGDFDQYFEVFAPDNYEVDARYVLTPDLMQDLIAAGQDYDFEIVNDHLYIYRHGGFVSPRGFGDAIEHAVRDVLHFRTVFRERTGNYSFAGTGGNTVAPQLSSVAAPVATLSGFATNLDVSRGPRPGKFGIIFIVLVLSFIMLPIILFFGFSFFG